eukprot:CAMPEP_0195581126 /NCGR_PEP_ID=MMETSP0814-20130614/19581_1 /TAXON_ID=97485 /ORGANISM="Prymnesium parvum, Strain Texoma1" /LENGTH=90 /DNA_ID=CAMNT_0040718419 /DNA_START=106 /DNA_END=375 /DNA_ORIENTATION=-
MIVGTQSVARTPLLLLHDTLLRRKPLHAASVLLALGPLLLLLPPLIRLPLQLTTRHQVGEEVDALHLLLIQLFRPALLRVRQPEVEALAV